MKFIKIIKNSPFSREFHVKTHSYFSTLAPKPLTIDNHNIYIKINFSFLPLRRNFTYPFFFPLLLKVNVAKIVVFLAVSGHGYLVAFTLGNKEITALCGTAIALRLLYTILKHYITSEDNSLLYCTPTFHSCHSVHNKIMPSIFRSYTIIFLRYFFT